MGCFVRILVVSIILQSVAFCDSPGHPESESPPEYDPNIPRTGGKTKIVILCPPFDSSPCFELWTIGEELVARGHDVRLLVSPVVQQKKPSILDPLVYDAPLPADMREKMIELLSGGMKSTYGLLKFAIGLLSYERFCTDTILKSNDTLGALNNADILLFDSTSFIGPLVSYFLGKPHVLLVTISFSAAAHTYQVPMPPSYVPILFNKGAQEQMNFMKRLQNVFVWFAADVLFTHGAVYLAFKHFSENHKVKHPKWYPDLIGSAEIVLVSNHFATEFAHPLMPNVFYVGPLMPKTASPLPPEYETYVQGSGEHGVVLVAFGSHRAQLDENVVKNMLNAFGKLKQRVIWKAELPDNVTVPNNVKLVSWMPQNDILGHLKTRAFVSHGGRNSLQEAAYHGVPVLSAPFIGDGSENCVRWENKAKMAFRIDIETASPQDWVNAVNEVIYNSSYKDNALKTSKLLKSHRRSPLQFSGDLIEYVTNNNFHVPHLRAHAFNLTWYEYHLIDVYAFIIFVSAFVLYIFYSLLKGFWNLMCKGRKGKKD